MYETRNSKPSHSCAVWPFWLAALASTALGFCYVWWRGFHRMLRRNVSPRGGNELAFVGMRQLFRTAYSFLGPLEVRGQENVPLIGGVIIASNHTSDADVTVLYTALPRWAWFLGKEEIFSIPFLGKLIQYYHAFPIRRTGPADRVAMKQVLDLLQEGEAVVMFPEGKLAEDGRLQAFQPGTAMLAFKAGVRVVPAALDGVSKVVPYGEVYPRPIFQRVRVRFGPPIDLSDIPLDDRHERLAIATQRIRAGVIELVKEISPSSLSPEDLQPVV